MTWLCIAADRRRGYAVPTSKGKMGQGHRMVPFPPLDSPKPSFALTHRRCAAKRGLRELGSVRRAGFGRLLCPEFPLRYPPRITVRGHPVQGGGVLLRKAPLRSSAVSWSSKRPCGPLVFRRATEGSRVLRKVWLSFPSCPRRRAAAIPSAGSSRAQIWMVHIAVGEMF